METKHKTLAECVLAEKILSKHGNWDKQGNAEWHKDCIINAMEEYAELYAGQTKQSEPKHKILFEGSNEIENDGKQNATENIDGLIRFFEDRGYTVFAPKQSDVEKAVEILMEYCSFDDVNGSEEVSLLPLTIIDIMLEYAKWQSQQPASVAFLSDDEIDRICELRFSADEDDRMFKLGIEVAQTELRKRVIDPVDLLDWINKENYEKIHGDRWCKQFMSQTHSSEELLQIYLTSKTK